MIHAIPQSFLDVYLRNRKDSVTYESADRVFLFNERLEMCQLIKKVNGKPKTLLHFEGDSASQVMKDFDFHFEWFGPRVDCAVDTIFDMHKKILGRDYA